MAGLQFCSGFFFLLGYQFCKGPSMRYHESPRVNFSHPKSLQNQTPVIFFFYTTFLWQNRMQIQKKSRFQFSKAPQKSRIGAKRVQKGCRFVPAYSFFQGLALIQGEIIQIWIDSLRIYTPFFLSTHVLAPSCLKFEGSLNFTQTSTNFMFPPS